MRRREGQPAALSDILDTLAGRLRRVDLRLIDEARRLWPAAAGPTLAAHCRVEMIKDGVLIVSVPSGAFAQRVTMDSPAILERFTSLGASAPTSLKTVIR